MQACGESFSAAFASASHAQGITEGHISDCRVCHTTLRDRRAIASLSIFRLLSYCDVPPREAGTYTHSCSLLSLVRQKLAYPILESLSAWNQHPTSSHPVFWSSLR